MAVPWHRPPHHSPYRWLHARVAVSLSQGLSVRSSPPTLAEGGANAPSAKPTDVPDTVRFLQEIEFVQMLANVEYLRHLAEADLLQQPAFIHYLNYLQYWRRPEYSQLLLYPQCLYLLEHLQDPRFRTELQKPEFVAWLRKQQILHWQSPGESLGAPAALTQPMDEVPPSP
eukprot:GGOE01042999.1.p1 GENE.GGOE01042999.1~~GGOE01042999.1.p1  ORF type:complete len:171 (+),score=55.26 GGOE01042999.1:649-1161(+)